MNIGRTVLVSFDQDGKHYDLICIKGGISEVNMTMWGIHLFEGVDTWENLTVVGEPIWSLEYVPDSPSTDFPATLEGTRKKVQETVDQINLFFKKKFSGSTPMTYSQMIESFLEKFILFRDTDGVPQVKIQE